uniref:protein disulfide-isomerase n=1 Tax=Heterorhabditis bacteriophora TaxID=37862 RepID=A0A1I7XJA3_HETBA
MRRFPVALVVGLLIIIRELHANTFPFQGHSRYKRQLGESSSHQIDLNITVPYIFSARLYPYGPSRGDLLIHGESEPYQLANPFHFLGQVYNTIYIESNGAVSFSPLPLSPAPLPVAHPLIAVYWMKTRGAKVFYRETDDANIVNLAHNEVNIQYRYGSQFRVRSVVVITWEGGRSQETDSEGNIFQLALIIGDSMTFAHIVYSKLNSNENAVAGFSSFNTSYSLPDSATGDAILLNEKSDIGIPGEWLFRIDDQQVFLCGAGFKGLECIDSCAPSQWFNDCSKSCHCDGSDPCDQETGRCPNGRCSPGWTGEPSCDQGSKSSVTSALIPVEVVPLKPSLVRISSTQKPSLARLTTASTTPSSTTTLQEIIQNKTNEIELLAPICPICSAHASCQNGICVCNPGWKEFGSSCIDIDECADGAHCGDHAECVNRPGSYDCTCEHGYRFENGHCFDIDECRENEACGNGLTVECVNHPGSFDCVCRDGFEGEPSKGCRDINECMLPGQFCGPHANCINTKLFYIQLQTTQSLFLEKPILWLPSIFHQLLFFSTNSMIQFMYVQLFINYLRLEEITTNMFQLSSNGVLSFDRPLPGIIERAESLREPVVFALHAQYDYAREGLVAYTYVNESDAAAYSLLTRSSIGIQNHFRLTSFHTRALHVFTFDRMRQAGSENLNSFQIILAQSDDATMLTLIYEKTETKGPMTG